MSEAEKNTNRKIALINKVLEKYIGGDTEKLLAGELMPEFIEAGAFEKDNRDGYPIRRFLDELYSVGRINEIPTAKPSGSKWFFVFHESKKYDKKYSDENYVINLCDIVLNETSIRQHKFDFLQGDVNENGKAKFLPVDAYYRNLSLVIEFHEDYHFPRDMNQRKMYDRRRKSVLPQHGIKLVEIDFYVFAYDSKYRIIRRPEEDLKTIRLLLSKELQLQL